jgi:hypothetical protein
VVGADGVIDAEAMWGAMDVGEAADDGAMWGRAVGPPASIPGAV